MAGAVTCGKHGKGQRFRSTRVGWLFPVLFLPVAALHPSTGLQQLPVWSALAGANDYSGAQGLLTENTQCFTVR